MAMRDPHPSNHIDFCMWQHATPPGSNHKRYIWWLPLDEKGDLSLFSYSWFLESTINSLLYSLIYSLPFILFKLFTVDYKFLHNHLVPALLSSFLITLSVGHQNNCVTLAVSLAWSTLQDTNLWLATPRMIYHETSGH